MDTAYPGRPLYSFSDYVLDPGEYQEADRRLPGLTTQMWTLCSLWDCTYEWDPRMPFSYGHDHNGRSSIQVDFAYWHLPSKLVMYSQRAADQLPGPGYVTGYRDALSRHPPSSTNHPLSPSKVTAQGITFVDVDWSSPPLDTAGLVHFLRAFHITSKVQSLGFKRCTFSDASFSDLGGAIALLLRFPALSFEECTFALNPRVLVDSPASTARAWASLRDLYLRSDPSNRYHTDRVQVSNQFIVLQALQLLPGVNLRFLSYTPQYESEVWKSLGSAIESISSLSDVEVRIMFPLSRIPERRGRPMRTISRLRIRYKSAVPDVHRFEDLSSIEQSALRRVARAIAPALEQDFSVYS